MKCGERGGGEEGKRDERRQLDHWEKPVMEMEAGRAHCACLLTRLDAPSPRDETMTVE
jgi:hypothetical protein